MGVWSKRGYWVGGGGRIAVPKCGYEIQEGEANRRNTTQEQSPGSLQCLEQKKACNNAVPNGTVTPSLRP